MKTYKLILIFSILFGAFVSANEPIDPVVRPTSVDGAVKFFLKETSPGVKKLHCQITQPSLRKSYRFQVSQDGVNWEDETKASYFYGNTEEVQPGVWVFQVSINSKKQAFYRLIEEECVPDPFIQYLRIENSGVSITKPVIRTIETFLIEKGYLEKTLFDPRGTTDTAFFTALAAYESDRGIEPGLPIMKYGQPLNIQLYGEINGTLDEDGNPIEEGGHSE